MPTIDPAFAIVRAFMQSALRAALCRSSVLVFSRRAFAVGYDDRDELYKCVGKRKNENNRRDVHYSVEGREL